MVASNNDLPSWGNELLKLLSIACPSLRAEAVRISPIEKKTEQIEVELVKKYVETTRPLVDSRCDLCLLQPASRAQPVSMTPPVAGFELPRHDRASAENGDNPKFQSCEVSV